MDEKKHIFLASPHMSGEGFEQGFIKEAFDTNWIAPLGNNVTMFEREIEEKLNAGKAVALSSGTAAIHMALKSAGVCRGDIVFCQSLTFSATANPILYEQAVPVFIDSDPSTWNMSPKALELAFEKYERQGRTVRAVIVVHLYGLCADMERIMEICRNHHVPLIEDAAESLGSALQLEDGTKKYTGTLGDYGIISFNGNKIITSSGGGMLLLNGTDAPKKAEKVLFWSTQARDTAPWYQHSEVGYNYRMSNVSAGIGRGQLKVLEQRVQRKREIYEYYDEQLGSLPGLSLMPRDIKSYSNCWLTAVQLSADSPVRPMEVIQALAEEDIESRPVWKPLHLQPVFAACGFITQTGNIEIWDKETGADTSAAGRLFENGVCLPSDTKMTDGDLERVCRVVKRIWKNKGVCS